MNISFDVKKFLGNSSLSILLKMINSLAAFAAVPLLLEILGLNNYGYWVTMTSMITWLVLMDLGIGFGLKNKVAQNDTDSNKQIAINYYIGTTHLFFLISVVLLILLPVVINLLGVNEKFRTIILYTYFIFILFFPMTTASHVLAGLRKVSFLTFLNAIPGLSWFVLLVLIKLFEINVSILTLSVVWVSTIVIGNILIFYFANKEIGLKITQFFSFRNIKFSFDLIKVSVKFFTLQICSLFMFNLGNFLTLHYLGSDAVATYDTVNKIFLFAMSLFNMVIAVAWPEITKSINIGNINSAKNLFRYSFYLAVLFSFSTFVISPFLPYIIEIWTRDKISVSYYSILPFCLLLTFQSIAYSGAVVLNATENLNGQIVLAIIASFITPILAIIFFKLDMGYSSFALSSSIGTIPSAILCVRWAKNILRREEESA